MSIYIKIESCEKCPYKNYLREDGGILCKPVQPLCNITGSNLTKEKILSDCPFRKMLIKGQEVVCPDGLGRVSKVLFGACNKRNIKVETYIDNRSCEWDEDNISFI